MDELLLAIPRLWFCCLGSFLIILRSDYKVLRDWDRFSSEMKDALLIIIQSSALKTLSLQGFTNISFHSIVRVCDKARVTNDSKRPLSASAFI